MVTKYNFFHFSDSDLFQLEEELEENEENEMLYDVTEDLNIGRTAEPSQSGYNSKWMQEFGFWGS